MGTKEGNTQTQAEGIGETREVNGMLRHLLWADWAFIRGRAIAIAARRSLGSRPRAKRMRVIRTVQAPDPRVAIKCIMKAIQFIFGGRGG